MNDSQIVWNRIETEEDLAAFVETLGGFHDACINEISYVSGAYVNANLSMKPINDIRTVDILVQRQYRNLTAIVMRFAGLDTLHLAPYDERYTCEILSASMFWADGLIYWADEDGQTSGTIEKYEGTWLCAKEMQWCAVDVDMKLQELRRNQDE